MIFRASRLRARRDEAKIYRDNRFFKDAPPARTDLAASRVCPRCESLLREEPVPSGYGYLAPGEVDLVCIAGHRFRAT